MSYPPPKAPAEAVIAGELIGWRVWRVEKGSLRSVYIRMIWEPGKPMTGDVDECFGVHAYKTLRDLKRSMYGFHLLFPSFESDVVYGEVALWGDVVEHERGYRAQFGKPVSLYAPPRPVLPMVMASLGIACGFAVAWNFFVMGIFLADVLGLIFFVIGAVNLFFLFKQLRNPRVSYLRKKYLKCLSSPTLAQK